MTDPIPFEKNRPLSECCTLGIGGPARYLKEVTTIEEMQETLAFCFKKKLPFFILGKGSNCLFDDRGYNGVVTINKIGFLEQPEPHLFHVGAGYSFSLLGAQTARKGFCGLEFASGIPGSVGGAVFMNAGANGHETYEPLVSVDFVTLRGERKLFSKEELQFAYRTSSFHNMRGAIVGATFALTEGEDARKKQLEIVTYRQRTQPYSEKSAGCIFRNPTTGHAGALIEESGLKGMQVGGARVSEMHANFIVNSDNATAKDVLRLIDLIKRYVKDKHQTDLESEVRYIPYDP